MMENKLYNPAGQSRDWLIANFVARTGVFKKIFKDIETGDMQYPEQHYLIQGQRGMGKTTLLLRLKYEIENTPELSKWLVPVFFNEECYDLTSLSNFWEKLLKYLDDLWQTGGSYYKSTDKFVGQDDYEKKCFELLINILKDEKKKLVIFFDNFGQLFLDNLKAKEQHRFREILMNCNDIRIIGASAVVLHDLHDYSKPFFEFFKTVPLEGLNKDETVELIKKLQETSDKKINIEKTKGKIETLAILTGGVIRTIMLIYEVILADEDGTALRDLEIILDRITPLYKHRIEDLPVQQRKIIDVIAKRWDAISTKEIAENIREDGKPMATKLISAQLQQLEKNNVIEKKQTNTKNHLYQLNERFFNIWYLMRNGDRMDRCRVTWLTRFLETWYGDGNEIEGFINKHIDLLRSGNYYPASALIIAEALTYSSKVNFESQALLVKATADILNEEQKKLLPSLSIDKLLNALDLFTDENYIEAINLLESIDQTSDHANSLLCFSYLNIDEPQKAIDIIDPGNRMKPYFWGLAFFKLGEYDKSLKYLKEALNSDELITIRGKIASEIGWIYKNRKKADDIAIEYYTTALKFNDYSSFKDLIDIYVEKKEYTKAEKMYLKAIDAGKTEFENDLIFFYIFIQKDYKKATKLIDLIPAATTNFADALFYRASIFEAADNETAFELFKKAYDLYKKDRNYTVNYSITVLVLSAFFIRKKNKISVINIEPELKRHETSLSNLFRACINIWNDEYTTAFSIIEKGGKELFYSDMNTNNAFSEFLILLLIAKKQYHFTMKLFEKPELELKDKLKPIYYALVQNLKEEYPNEYLKMGEELRQPVNDIVKKIDEMAVEYA